MLELNRRAFLYGAAGTTLAAGLGLTSCSTSSSGSESNRLTISEPDIHTNPDPYNRVTERFNEEHDVVVEQVAPPFGQYDSEILTQLEAGSPPDIIRVDDTLIDAYLARGWLEPLDEVLAQANLAKDDLIPASYDIYQDDTPFGIVAQTNPRAFIYNTQLYDEAGVVPPTDAAAFIEAIEKTTDADVGQFGIGFNTEQGDPTGFLNQLTPYIYGYDGGFYADGAPIANSAQNIEALEFLQDLWNRSLMPRGMGSTDINGLVQSGKLANNINGAFIIFYAKETDPEVAEHLTTAPNPLPSDRTMRASAIWAIPANAKNKEAAKAYLTKFLELEVQQEFQAANAFVVARRDGVSEEFMQDNPWFEPIRQAAVTGAAESYYPQGLDGGGGSVLKTLGEGILPVFHSNADPKTALDRLQETLESLS